MMRKSDLWYQPVVLWSECKRPRLQQLNPSLSYVWRHPALVDEGLDLLQPIVYRILLGGWIMDWSLLGVWNLKKNCQRKYLGYAELKEEC